MFNEIVSGTSSAVSITAPSVAAPLSFVTVGHTEDLVWMSGPRVEGCTLSFTSALSSARSTLMMTGGPPSVAGTSGTDWSACWNASVALGCVAEAVGDTDASTSDKIGITIPGN